MVIRGMKSISIRVFIYFLNMVQLCTLVPHDVHPPQKYN